MAAASLYNHFSSLDDMLAGVVESLLGEMTEAYEKVADLPADEAMSTVVKAHVSAFAARPGAARIVLTDFNAPRGISAIDQVEAQIDHVYALDHELIQRGQKQKTFRKVNSNDVMLTRIGMTLMLLSDRWFETSDLTTRETQKVASTIADFTLRLLSRPQSPE